MSPIAIGLILVAQGILLSAFAQETNDTQRLLKVIEEQQRRLDAQEAQLSEQKKALQDLRKQVEQALQGAGQMATTPPIATNPPAVATGETAKPSYPGLETAKMAVPAPQQEWPGSFGVEALKTRFKIGGFVELDAIYDTDAIQTPSAFVTKAIVTRDATASQGASGQANWSVQATRVELESRTQLDDHQIKTFTAVDFFNDFGSTTPELRLRQAYGEINHILLGGDLLFGQDWSTYANLYAIPNVLDFQGVNSLLGARHPMVRWTKPLGEGWIVKLAAEAPDVRQFENASSASTWPDGVVALNWAKDTYNLQGSFLARDLRASGDNGPVVSTFGWATSLAGRIYMPGALKQDFATFQLCYGEGFGGVLNDTPADATYNPANNDFEAIPTLAWYLGYQHWWNPKFYSVISYGEIREDNTSFQSATAYKKTQYASANLTWVPFEQWLFGFEVLYGTREDNDGADGHDVRTQFTTRFNF